MSALLPLQPFPCGAESNGFFAALTSAIMHCKGITEDTPVWCNPEDRYCTRCGSCDAPSRLHKHHEMMYHALITVSGVAFTFDYPEDDEVPYHTMPGIPRIWRWDDAFIDRVTGLCGLTYHRYRNKPAAEMTEIVRTSLDAGYTALCARYADGIFTCWSVVSGVSAEGIHLLKQGGDSVIAEGLYDDWIVLDGVREIPETFSDVLRRIRIILTDPSHDRLEQELMNDLSHVTPENAAGLVYKLMGICGVFIETRWHAAEAMLDKAGLLCELADKEGHKNRMGQIFFDRVIANGNNETHCTGWKIWAALEVGPDTGYMPTARSFALIQQPEVQKRLASLYRIVFENDRHIAQAIAHELEHTAHREE